MVIPDRTLDNMGSEKSKMRYIQAGEMLNNVPGRSPSENTPPCRTPHTDTVTAPFSDNEIIITAHYSVPVGTGSS